MKAIDRVMESIHKKGLKPAIVERDLSLSNGYLATMAKRKGNLGEDVLLKLSKYLDFSLIELITGEQPTLVKESNKQSGIPLVSIHAIGGFGNSRFAIQEKDVKAYYVVPKFQGCKVDFMIEVAGSSMYPKYNSGDVVACTIIRERHFIQWNKVHVIGTKEQGILIKRLKKGAKSNYITAISDNKDYDPFDIPENEITGIALVIGVIRLE